MIIKKKKTSREVSIQRNEIQPIVPNKSHLGEVTPKKYIGSSAPDSWQSIVVANIDRIAAVIQQKTQRGERVLVLCIYAAFRELLASFLRNFYGWDISTKQSSTSQVAHR